MYHSFDADIATEYGIPEAIFLCNIAFWVKQNTLNKHNCFEGKYWTYNSMSAYAGLFPYMSKSTIQRVVKHLKDEGLILTGNFNNDKFNHTNYYTLTEKGLSLVHNSVSRNSQNGVIEGASFNSSIFNSNTDSTDINNTDINEQIPPIIPRKDAKLNELFEQFWRAYPKKVKKQNALREFKKVKDIETLMPAILADVEFKKQTNNWKKDNGQFIPDPERYIKNERWNDVNEASKVQTKFDEAADEHFRDFFMGG